MLRVTIIPVSMLLAYVFFTPMKPLDSLDHGRVANVTVPQETVPQETVPQETVLVSANPADANSAVKTSNVDSVLEEAVAEEPSDEETVAEEAATKRPHVHGPVDIAQGLAVLVVASRDPRDESRAEPAGEEWFDHNMALETTEEIAMVDEPPFAERAAEEPAMEERAEEESADADMVAEEPAEQEPATEEPAAEEPAEKEPAADQPIGDKAERTADSQPQVLPEPKPELSPAMAAVRDRLRRTTAAFYRRTPSSNANTATDLMHYCLAFGCQSQIVQGGSSSAKSLNGITHLCWNYPCGGFQPLVLSDGRIAAKIGYGTQQKRSQLLAVLALSRVQADYPMRVGEYVGTVADLVEHEKLDCRADDDLSLKLIGLSYYVDDPTWTNRLGEEWSVERMVQTELDSPFPGADARGTDRLIALDRALAQCIRRELPVDGQFARAQGFLEDYQRYALTLQNSDGSWGPQFLAARGTGGDQAVVLDSTGHVLQWLVLSLPEDQLEDPRIVRSIEYVGRLLGSSRYGSGLQSLSAQEIGSVMHALHALMVYDQRYLAPRTPKPEPTAEAT